MPKLNDTQTILLSTASRRDDLAFFPLEGITAGVRVTKAIDRLIKAGFAEQRGDSMVFATIAGLTAISVEVAQGGEASEAPPASSEPRTSTCSPTSRTAVST